MLQCQHRRSRIHVVNAVGSPVAHQPLGTPIVEDRRAISGADKTPSLRTGRIVIYNYRVVVVVVCDGGCVAEGVLDEQVVGTATGTWRTGRVHAAAVASDQDVAALVVDELVVGAVGRHQRCGRCATVGAHYFGHVLGEARKEFGVEGTWVGLNRN